MTNKNKKNYDADRWQGSPKEFVFDSDFKPTIEQQKKHDEFMKKFQKAYGLDENGNELPKKQE
ncbi:hypothetical protein MOO45_02835 [Bombilactobacillus folatiphilus]|uniref:Uncharacterized protein n=1 Tax=Bombilactobacillus folatiphilus TaxID=2923362 RepID=A0ABY4PAF0_9LACO|nr:hypothetical protein [Bombilactobacillus folatiphilus]UQS82600.1 hypothetical protein MOO45_02835 [Bombilactobacillus folatiphilus]